MIEPNIESPTPGTESDNTDNVTDNVTDNSKETETEVNPDDNSATFSADYVKALREESAAHRIKAKRIDEANQRLLRSVAESDGRLVNVDELGSTDDLLDDDGIIDPDKVRGAIGALISAKPYLATRRPTTAIPQGVQGQISDMPSLFNLVAERS